MKIIIFGIKFHCSRLVPGSLIDYMPLLVLVVAALHKIQVPYLVLCIYPQSCLIQSTSSCSKHMWWWPCDAMLHTVALRQHWLRQWLVAWRHQAITWTNVDFLSIRICGIHLEQFHIKCPATILYNEFENYTFKITATTPRGQWVKS